MNIPIQNVYYLLCYAWGHLQEKELVDASGNTADRPEDLFSHVLANAVSRVLRRGLAQGYIGIEEEVPGVRGKIEFSMTLKANLLPKGRTHCSFEEFRRDITLNQIIKATLHRLRSVESLDSTLKGRLKQLYRRFDDVTAMAVSRKKFRAVQIHRNNKSYDFLIKLCMFIHDNILVEEESGTIRFYDFRRDDATMWKLFENFVFNFYCREQAKFRVSRPHIRWNDAQGTEQSLRYLPIMRTDVFLESQDRRIILDCKYTSQPLSPGQFGDERVKIDNLYQIFAYIINRSANAGRDPIHEGILLYPAVSKNFNLRYRIMGFPITVRTIDLSRPWEQIHRDLLQAVA